MTDSDLDIVYTRLCKTMTQLGQPNTSLFLARFAMLAIDRIDDPTAAMNLIDDASEGMPESAPQWDSNR
ncbi:hypothetical protein [Paraburkholderia youngii]|uniref:hypothetical protein n=1 Tax=Paraburkholderia youngii TaxID=2782701 RepID=UPI003D1BBFE0